MLRVGLSRGLSEENGYIQQTRYLRRYLDQYQITISSAAVEN